MIANSQCSDRVIQPGSTLGIFGSGQLGKMTAIAAKQMGYRVHVFSPSSDTPAGQVADLEIQASYTDAEAVADFAKNVDVVTLEFENIPVETLEIAGQYTLVHPGVKALKTMQNRLLEKQFLTENGIPTCQFKVVRSLTELRLACQSIMPGVLKTTKDGYDGKGQAIIRTESDVESAWESLNTSEAILEEWIEFDFEFSVVAARNSAGQFAAYPSILNEHQNQILDVSISPSGLAEHLNLEATKIAHEVMDKMSSVGVMCVEFFCCEGRILVNEVAPRPHNSGHLTIEGHFTNQFEQHVRAVCGLMLGSTRQTNPVAMANLLGDQWSFGEPKWHLGLSMSNIKLHLYGKKDPASARKMGHMTAIANSAEQAREHIIAARNLLSFNQLLAGPVRVKAKQG
ncbi:MAG: 5-(carboxyamino)imidazole ribonucleotide synthase [Mariniblastus sp.]|jgi:5-(carboxyamino)imidazole ribonucleotide synthase